MSYEAVEVDVVPPQVLQYRAHPNPANQVPPVYPYQAPRNGNAQEQGAGREQDNAEGGGGEEEGMDRRE